MKLEIGAGERPTPGYTHQDVRDLPDIEVVCDARQLLDLYGPKSWGTIRACHVLEHFGRLEVHDVLSSWVAMLEDGGELHIEVPNFAWQTRSHYVGELTDDEAVYYVFGEQDYPENAHRCAFTQATLERALEQAGLSDVRVVDVGAVLVADGIRWD